MFPKEPLLVLLVPPPHMGIYVPLMLPTAYATETCFPVSVVLETVPATQRSALRVG